MPNVELHIPYVTHAYAIMVLEGAHGDGARSARRKSGWEVLPRGDAPIDVDEDELLGELDALEDELAAEASAAPASGEAAATPSYLSEEPTDLPAAPARPVAVGGGGASGGGGGTAVAQRN